MSKPTLFVCKSCHNDTAQTDSKTPQGTCLLNRLKELQTDSSFVIKGENCLWMCDQPCVVAISATDKPTYLYADVPFEESAEALLEFASFYVNHKQKSIKIPKVLESVTIARIPPI